MKAFISHNAGDKATARLLGTRLAEVGLDVWFDEWKLRPGDSIVGGIENGIKRCDTFVLVWSQRAKRSKWVTAELRAMIVRRVANAKLKIVPVMVDGTPLPPLVADYKGFRLSRLSDLDAIAREIIGNRDTLKQSLQVRERFLQLVAAEFPAEDSIRSLSCPNCASRRLVPDIYQDPLSGDLIYEFVCGQCRQSHGTIVRRGEHLPKKPIAPVAYPPPGYFKSANAAHTSSGRA